MKAPLKQLIAEHFEQEVRDARHGLVRIELETSVQKPVLLLHVTVAAVLLAFPGGVWMSAQQASPLAESVDRVWQEGGQEAVQAAIESLGGTISANRREQ